MPSVLYIIDRGSRTNIISARYGRAKSNIDGEDFEVKFYVQGGVLFCKEGKKEAVAKGGGDRGEMDQVSLWFSSF